MCISFSVSWLVMFSGEDWGVLEHEDSDGDLIESLGELAFSDQYRGQVAGDVFSHYSDFAADRYRPSSTSPSKRARDLSDIAAHRFRTPSTSPSKRPRGLPP